MRCKDVVAVVARVRAAAGAFVASGVGGGLCGLVPITTTYQPYKILFKTK